MTQQKLLQVLIVAKHSIMGNGRQIRLVFKKSGSQEEVRNEARASGVLPYLNSGAFS